MNVEPERDLELAAALRRRDATTSATCRNASVRAGAGIKSRNFVPINCSGVRLKNRQYASFTNVSVVSGR